MNKLQKYQKNYQKEYYQNVTKRKQHGLEPVRKKKLPPPGTFFVPFFGFAQVGKLGKEGMKVVMARFYNSK